MKSVRRTVDKALPVVGIVVVLGAVVFLWCGNLYLQLAIVLVGIFLIEAGIWKLAHPLLPSVRKYRALRTEVDKFIHIVRRLNTAAVARDAGDPDGAAGVEAVRQDMIEAIDRILDYAGKETDVRPVGPA